MNRYLLCALLLCVAPLQAAIDGTVMNGTTNKPQPGVTVTLVKPGAGGMQTLGSTVSDASGHFAFEHDQPGGGPQLLQALFNGINYNRLMTPNVPTSNVQLEVFESSKSPDVAHIAQQVMFIEPSSQQITVNERVIVQNESTSTYSNPALGSLRFFLPKEANGEVKVQAQGPQGMPLPQTADKTETAGIYKVNFPVKPGKTEFEVEYVLPATSPAVFHGQVVGVKGMPVEGALHLVAPAGVTLAGDGLESAGTEPKSQAAIYTVTATGAFNATITGTGSMTAPQANQPDNESPPVTEGQPQIYKHLGWLLSLSLAILAVGLVYLYTTSPVRAPYGK